MNNESSDRLRLVVTGQVACFRRPEFSDDLVSYDIMPPTVARRLLDATFPLSTGRWVIERITVLNPIRFNWMDLSTSRGKRHALVLTNVAYLLEASVASRTDDGVADAGAAPWRRSPDHVAHLGLSDFVADIAVLGPDEQAPVGSRTTGIVDLGWMFYDITAKNRNLFFRAAMVDGTLDLRNQDTMFRAS